MISMSVMSDLNDRDGWSTHSEYTFREVIFFHEVSYDHQVKYGGHVGDSVEFGGLLGRAPIMPVNSFSCDRFVARAGRIPAPVHSFKN